MPVLAPLPSLRPSKGLDECLVELSHLCNIAVAAASPAPQIVLLVRSTRQHAVNPIRLSLLGKTPPIDALDHFITVTTLHTILTAVVKPSASLGRIYNALDQAITSLAPGPTVDTLTAIWQDLHALLSPQLSHWLFRGLILDSANFFITKGMDESFIVHTEDLPPFIPKDVASNILHAGLARRTAAIINPREQCAIASVFLPLPGSSLSFSAAATRWREDASSYLSTVLPFGELHHKLVAIRDFLLQGDTLFWRSFFDRFRTYRISTQCDDDETRRTTERALNATLTTLTDGSPPFLFTVKQGVQSSIALSYVESQLLARRCDVYTSLFEITFNARRASMNLQYAFLHCRELHRHLRPLHHSLAWVMELRRQMADVLQGMEAYIQLSAVQPAFNRVFDVCQQNMASNDNKLQKPSFDSLVEAHERGLDEIEAKCFLKKDVVRARLFSMFEICIVFSNFVLELTAGSLRELSTQEKVKSFSNDFDRNAALLYRLLSQSEEEKLDIYLSTSLSCFTHL